MLWAKKVPTEVVQLSTQITKNSLQEQVLYIEWNIYLVKLKYLFWLFTLHNLIYRCQRPNCQWSRCYCYRKCQKCRNWCDRKHPLKGWNGNWKDGKITCVSRGIRYYPSYWYSSKAGYLEPRSPPKNKVCNAYRRMSSVTCSEITD